MSRWVHFTSTPLPPLHALNHRRLDNARNA